MKRCICGGNAVLIGHFITGYRVQCKRCGKHTPSSDKGTALKKWHTKYFNLILKDKG